MKMIVKKFLLLVFFFCVDQLNCESGANMDVDLTEVEGRKKEEDVMMKILPMLAMPFITQTALVPIALMSMKFMLIKSMILGKFAIFLAFITFLRNLLKKPGGVYSHNINIVHPEHELHHHEHAQKKYGDIYEPYVYTKKRRKEENV